MVISLVKQKVRSDEEIVEPAKVIKEKRRRIQILERTTTCPICKQDIVFKITNRFLDGILKNTEKVQETHFHDPLRCLYNAPVDFETKREVEKCGNCKNWAGTYRCDSRCDEHCNKHSRLITEEEYEWIKKHYPDKLKTWNGKEITFEDMQMSHYKLKYVCYEDEWCEHYEDDR